VLTLAICTYNRSDLLPRALDAVLAQTYPRDGFEILVVDNASTDATPNVVAGYTRRAPFVRYVREPRPGIAHARNRAATDARGKYLAFLDDDAWAEPNWLDELVKPLTGPDPAPACVVGPVQLVWEGRRPDWFPARHEPLLCQYDMGSRPCLLGRDGYFLTTNSLFHRETLLGLGGFLTNLGRVRGVPMGGEDNEICQRFVRSGNPVLYQPSALVYHPVPPDRQTRGYLVHRLYWDGATQPLLDSGTGRPRSHYLRQGTYDLRRIARFTYDAVRASLCGDRTARRDSGFALIQRVGRLRTHLLLAAGRIR
jgi:glycosyltransferase involved in cell wall biosynthesis